ncbi:dicarboxylate/amino acid:cation symporter [Bacillus sp. MRMR6]|uniref:dicarboxylate/amino acid:cation symporter n=1 Tax=Bacillus sp. MRMR6 TaxID=1928617 RepID=UPI000951CCC8|nr:dicarboxylate/amino acid:cation symporter [Bacillus sp. MRMR6]OLS40379.1 dicarboxylate/amino acid:cation symporter [Bacillus sp. MRMR6]
MSLTKKIFVGMGLGIVFGLILNLALPNLFGPVNSYFLVPLGKLFVNLIKMLVVPIVVVSLILGTAGISDPKKLGRMGLKTITFFLATTVIALVLSIGAGLLVKPGEGDFKLDGATFEGAEAPPVIDTLLNIIPANPLGSMANGEMLQVIAFAMILGFGISRVGQKAEGILKLVEQLNDVLMYLVTAIMKFAPYGAFALIATAIGGQGLGAIAAMGKYMFVVLFVLLLQLVITYGSAVSFLGKMNPIAFFKGFSPAVIVAFSTSSSAATLPVSMRAAQNNLNISKSVSSFVQPLGATINMDGTAIMQGVATIFIAQVYGIDLSFGQMLTVILTATLASIGTAGVPGVGLIMLSMVLTSVGLPVEAIALVLGVDRLLDMCRTAVNITGDAACALYVSRSEGEGDPDVKVSNGVQA